MYSNELVCNILSYIDENIKNKISIDDLVIEFNYNRFYIMKLFKRELDISIIDYINTIKIYSSLSYINDNHSFLSCALISGYYSLEYYSEMFKRILGVNPSTYKKIINRNPDIKIEELDIFTNNLAQIKRIINKCNTYKLNIAPSTLPAKKLSIFK